MVEDEWVCIWGQIADWRAVDDRPKLKDVLAQVLQANHDAELLRFEVDAEGWLEAAFDLPTYDVDIEEVADAVWRVGRLADRWELLWTGADVI